MAAQYRYFMVTYYTKPGGQVDEGASYSRRVKNSDYTSQNVILDFTEKKIIKCTINGERLNIEWDKLVDYYRKVYPVLISQLEEANTSTIVDSKNP